MKQPISDIAFTPSVKAAQERMGSRKHYAQMEQRGGWQATINDELAEFIGERDSFYLATANRDGQPYIQHRGGPKGFLKVLDGHTLAFADFVGNRQYITVGNLAENGKAFIFLMDYANQTRIKIWGAAEVIENDPALTRVLADLAYGGRPERAIRFRVEAWDVNCRQHIKRRFAEEDITATIASLQRRIVDLEEMNNMLKQAAPGSVQPLGPAV